LTEIQQVKTSKQFIDKASVETSKLVIEKFIECCQSLDAGIFEPFIQEDDVFQEVTKYEFLAQLKSTFDKTLKLTGNTFTVEISTDSCRGCFIGHKVHVFSTFDKSKKLAERNGYVIQEQDGILIDISRCYYYSDLPPGVDPKIWESRIGIGYTK